MNVRSILLPILTFVVFIAFWEAAVRLFSIPVYLLPAPFDVGLALVQLAPVFHLHIWATLVAVLIGFVISLLMAMPAGILVATCTIASEAIYPLLVFMNAVPIVAVAPIIVVIFGTGIEARLVIVVMVTFFPMMVATATGILDTPQRYLDLSRAVGNGFLMELLTIRMPHAAPFIFSGMKIGMSLSVIGAIVGEFITSQRGLGYLIISNTTNFDLPRAVAAVVVLALMSVLLYQLVQFLQSRYCPWIGRN